MTDDINETIAAKCRELIARGRAEELKRATLEAHKQHMTSLDEVLVRMGEIEPVEYPDHGPYVARYAGVGEL